MLLQIQTWRLLEGLSPTMAFKFPPDRIGLLVGIRHHRWFLNPTTTRHTKYHLSIHNLNSISSIFLRHLRSTQATDLQTRLSLRCRCPTLVTSNNTPTQMVPPHISSQTKDISSIRSKQPHLTPQPTLEIRTHPCTHISTGVTLP